jgi:hypothetical protein
MLVISNIILDFLLCSALLPPHLSPRCWYRWMSGPP